MKIARVLCFLVALGISAIATYAQTPLPALTSAGAGDPKLVFPDACPTGAICSTITTTTAVDIPDCTKKDTLSECLAIGLVFPLASPISVGPRLSSLWYCTQDMPDTFDEAAALGTTYILGFEISSHFAPQFPGETGTFTGCEYWSGDLSAHTTYGVADVGGTAPFLIPEGHGIEDAGDPAFTPEPGTSLLYVSGLLLISLGDIARKRFGTTSRT
jgi:hypothetical protein